MRKRRQLKKTEQLNGNTSMIGSPCTVPVGKQHTFEFGRPIGWVVFLSLFEKISFPIVLVIMIYAQWWQWLGLTVLTETTLYLLLISIFGLERRAEYVMKGLLATPLRYASIVIDIFTIFKFAFDLSKPATRIWRK